MDGKVVVPITKLKARNAWGVQPSGGAAADFTAGHGKGRDKGGTNGCASPPSILTAGGKCKCCPYGYHIDLDFVRYCESLVSGDYVRQLKQLHRSRRQQRKSMEALLGCYGDQLQQQQQQRQHVGSLGSHYHAPPPDLVTTGDALRDALRDAMLDFEDTYKMSSAPPECRDCRPAVTSSKVPRYLELAPIDLLTNTQNISVYSSSDGSGSDATSPNVPSYPLLGAPCGLLQLSPRPRSDSIGSLSTISSSTTATDALSCYSVPVAPPSKHMADTMEALAHCSFGLDTNSMASREEPLHTDRSSSPSVVCIDPTVLQSIRDQMAVSLGRMKELEDHARAIPILQVKLSVLKEEKRLLMLQLKAKTAKLDQKGADGFCRENDALPGSSLVPRDPANLDRPVRKESRDLPPQRRTRTMSVSCAVMTRDVGVGSLPMSTRSVAVACEWTPPSPTLCSSCQASVVDGSVVELLALSRTRHGRFVVPPACPVCEQVKPKVCHSRAVATEDREARNVGTSPPRDLGSTMMHSAFVQAVPSCRNVQLQASFEADAAKPQTADKRIGCTVSVRHSGASANLVTVVATRDIGCGDASTSDVDCESCTKRQLGQKSIGVGQQGVKDLLLCDRCTGLRTFNIGVGTDSTLLHSRTRNVGSGLCTVRDLLCDRCTSLCTASVATSTDGLTVSSAVVLCDKCSGDISSVARCLAGTEDRPAEAVLAPIVEAPAAERKGLAAGHGQEFRKRRPPMEFYISQGFSEEERGESISKLMSHRNVPSATTGNKGGGAVTVSGESSDSSDGDDSSSTSSDSIDEASYDSVRGVIVHSCQDDEAIRQGRPGAVMFQPIQESPRHRNEMSDATKKACTVLDGHLKSTAKAPSKDVNASLSLIRQEWFRISSQKNTDQHVVEDYLDALESVSHNVLSEVVNLADGNGNTAMHYAISYANFDVVSLLLDSKVCNINRPNKAGYTCLMLASLASVNEESHLNVLRQLFKLGDINTKASQHGQTALMLAASHGKMEMVRLLLDAGADINIRDDDGSTALMCASEHGHLGVVRLLLANVDCDPNLADNDGSTALSIAMEAGHKDIGVMIYAATSLSRGSSPYASLRQKRRGSTPTRRMSTPPPRTPPPPSPAWSRKSTSSVP